MKPRALFTSLFIIALTFVWSWVAVLTWPLSPRGDLFLFYARQWARLIFRVGGIKLRTQVSPQLCRKARYVYLSNHESLTDILALFAAVPQPVVMVAKRSLFILPIFSWGMWLAGFVFIDRKNRAAAYRSIEAAGERVRKGRSVVVFPEGTRAEGEELLKFKRGGFVLARSARVPIVPVGIHGTREVLPKNRFCVCPGQIAVCIGAPMPVPEASENMEAFMLRVREEVEQLRRRARVLWEGLAAPQPSNPGALAIVHPAQDQTVGRGSRPRPFALP